MKKDENVIHIKFDYPEALNSKRDILNSEKSLLTILKKMKNYHELRNQELELREKLHKKIKNIVTNTSKIKRIIPKLKIPDILKKENFIEDNEESEKEKIPQKKIKRRDNTLEAQLEEIQEKLRALHQEQ